MPKLITDPDPDPHCLTVGGIVNLSPLQYRKWDVLTYLFLGEALLPEEESGDGLGGVAEESLLLQVGQPALRLQVKFFHPGQQPSEQNSGGFIDTKILI